MLVHELMQILKIKHTSVGAKPKSKKAEAKKQD